MPAPDPSILGGQSSGSTPPGSPRRARQLRAVVDAGAPLPRLDRITVLLIDDNLDARVIIAQMLEPLGARVLLARDGGEGLAVLRDATPDVILCDLLMPRMDGFEVRDRIRRDPRHTRVPIIAVTALGSAPDYLRTWEAGFDGHVSKPVNDRELAMVVRRLGRSRRDLLRAPRSSRRPRD
jgi:CheY-like chemotaxis protein